jgi:hypothetical protein
MTSVFEHGSLASSLLGRSGNRPSSCFRIGCGDAGRGSGTPGLLWTGVRPGSLLLWSAVSSGPRLSAGLTVLVRLVMRMLGESC